MARGCWTSRTARCARSWPIRTAEEFTWSPDGRRVAYHSRRIGRLGCLDHDRALTVASSRVLPAEARTAGPLMARQLAVAVALAAMLAAGCARRIRLGPTARAATPTDISLPARGRRRSRRACRATPRSTVCCGSTICRSTSSRPPSSVGARRLRPARSARGSSLPARPLARRRAARVRVSDRRRQLPADLQPGSQPSPRSLRAEVVPYEKETTATAVRGRDRRATTPR